MSPDGPHSPQTAGERAALGGDAASQALNEALRVSFWLLKFAMVGVVVLFFFSGCYEVKEYEQAIVLRFGRVVYHTDTEGNRTPLYGAGLHLAWPFLIDEVVRFPVGAVIEEPVEAFWYKEREEDPNATVPAGIKPGTEGFNLTADANILHSHWRVFYRIADPLKFCERLADPAALTPKGATGHVRGVVHSLLRNAIIRTIARYSVDDAYRNRKKLLQDEVQTALILHLKKLDVGIAIERVTLDAIVPPRQAKGAFDDVIEAEQEHSEQKHKAQGKASEILNAAKAEASRTKAQALAYKVRVKEQADADAAYIEDLLNKFPDKPDLLDIFLEHHLVEVLEETLKDAEEIYVVRPGPGGRQEIRLYIKPDPTLEPQPGKDEDDDEAPAAE